MANKRKARCHCGQLGITCAGEPTAVVMCHCEHCQRRTGTSYNLGAWFQPADMQIAGKEKTFMRDNGEQGIELTFHFCPDCGTSLYWTTNASPRVGVAVGCFSERDFPAPTISIYGKHRHAWLQQPAGMSCHVDGIGSTLENE